MCVCVYMQILSYIYSFLRQGFSVSSEPVLELALVDQAVLELTEISLPLPPSGVLRLKACTTTAQLPTIKCRRGEQQPQQLTAGTDAYTASPNLWEAEPGR